MPSVPKALAVLLATVLRAPLATVTIATTAWRSVANVCKVSVQHCGQRSAAPNAMMPGGFSQPCWQHSLLTLHFSCPHSPPKKAMAELAWFFSSGRWRVLSWSTPLLPRLWFLRWPASRFSAHSSHHPNPAMASALSLASLWSGNCSLATSRRS